MNPRWTAPPLLSYYGRVQRPEQVNGPEPAAASTGAVAGPGRRPETLAGAAPVGTGAFATLGEVDAWLTPARFAFILAALIFAAFPQVLLGWETFVVRDYGFFSFPVAHFQRECFWRGELPLWNPYNNCGLPFLAQWNTMALYPPALVYLLFPLAWSLSFFCLLHLFWGGLGMYFLARRWTGNLLAASVAGVIFAFNGLSLNLLMWPSHIATLSWMPWVVLAVERGWREGGRSLLVGAVAGTLQMLAGGPESILFTWLVLSALWVMTLWEQRKGRLWAVARRFPLTVLLVAGIAAAQLAPFLDLAAHSQREQGFADARWSMPGWGWANFLVPMVFGNTWGQHLFFQYGQFWTSSYYLGLTTLLAGALGLWMVRSRRVWLLTGVAVVAVLLAGGESNPFARYARRLIPQLTLMTYPVKFLLLLVFAAPLLAAYGVAQLRQAPSAAKAGRYIPALTLMLLAAIGAVLFWAWRWPLPQDDFATTLSNGLSRLGFAAVIGALLWAVTRSWAPKLQRLLPLLLLLICWLDAWTHEPTQNPTVPAGIYQTGLARSYLKMSPQPELGSSRAMVSPAAETKFLQRTLEDPQKNFLAKRMGYFADCNLLDNVPKVNGFFSIYPRECGNLATELYGRTNDCPAGLADFLSVSQMTAPGVDTADWSTRTNFMPWATAGQQPVFVNDTNALGLLQSARFDGRRFVLLPPDARELVSVTNRTEAQILQQRFDLRHAWLEVEAPQPSLVVLSQTFYHCWRAFVDGQPAPLLRANYAFQAVQVPAGKHSIRLVYEDRAFEIGLLISAATFLGCVAAWIWFKSGARTSARSNALC